MVCRNTKVQIEGDPRRPIDIPAPVLGHGRRIFHGMNDGARSGDCWLLLPVP